MADPRCNTGTHAIEIPIRAAQFSFIHRLPVGVLVAGSAVGQDFYLALSPETDGAAVLVHEPVAAGNTRQLLAAAEQAVAGTTALQIIRDFLALAGIQAGKIGRA